jgi:hypothetical protein
MNTLEQKLKNPDILQKILQHLQDPLNPNTTAEKELEEIVHFPLKNPFLGGGLTPKAEKIALKSNHTELIKASQTHKEKTRINIQAILKTCELYIRSQQKKITPEETKALKQGIAFRLPNGKIEAIVALIQGGELLSKPLQRMMNNLFTALNKEKNRYSYLVKYAAKLHLQNGKKQQLQPA